MNYKRSYTLDFGQIGKEMLAMVGGKNASLGEMTKAGIRVPPGFAVTTDSYHDFLKAQSFGDGIFTMLDKVDPSDPAGLEKVSAEVRNLIETSPIPAAIEAEIKKYYQALCEKCGIVDVPVAVRSSATAEDLPTASFAGQQDTYLYIKGTEQLLEAVRKCWASLFTARAIGYRTKNNISHEKTLISVGVQKMVNAKVSGVAFTLNPANGDPSQAVIEGSWGLGEAVVSGNVTPDHFMVDKVSLEITKRQISSKHIKCVPIEEGGVKELEVPSEKRLEPSLEEKELVELVKIAKQLEQYYGCPQDVEWAIDLDLQFPDNVFIVQSRPETVWSQKKVESRLANKTSQQLLMEQACKIIKVGV